MQPQAYRDSCREDLQRVKDTLVARDAQYTVSSSAAQWATALQSAAVAIQYEEMASNRRTRDEAMADNATWLLNPMPPDGKIVLWAHNGHVSVNLPSSYRAMGSALRDTWGQKMVVVGFDFARGTFNAIGVSGSAYTALTSHTVGDPPQYSYEDYFHAAALPRSLIDLRNRDQRPDTPAWLAGPVRRAGSPTGPPPEQLVHVWTHAAVGLNQSQVGSGRR